MSGNSPKRNTLLLKLTDMLGPRFVRTWMGTLRVRTFAASPAILPSPTGPRGAIYAGWHESLLAPAYLYANCHAYALVSQSLDGEYIARVVQRLGWRVIRGSSSQGGISGLWDVTEKLASHSHADFFVTADGPVGPRRVFKEGAIYLASRMSRPLILIGLAYERPWRARSWDRFILPRPFSRACVVFGRPIHVPPNINKSNRALYRSYVQEAMERVQEEAEGWLALLTGRGSSYEDKRFETQLRPTHDLEIPAIDSLNLLPMPEAEELEGVASM